MLTGFSDKCLEIYYGKHLSELFVIDRFETQSEIRL